MSDPADSPEPSNVSTNDSVDGLIYPYDGVGSVFGEGFDYTSSDELFAASLQYEDSDDLDLWSLVAPSMSSGLSEVDLGAAFMARPLGAEGEELEDDEPLCVHISDVMMPPRQADVEAAALPQRAVEKPSGSEKLRESAEPQEPPRSQAIEEPQHDDPRDVEPGSSGDEYDDVNKTTFNSLPASSEGRRKMRSSANVGTIGAKPTRPNAKIERDRSGVKLLAPETDKQREAIPTLEKEASKGYAKPRLAAAFIREYKTTGRHFPHASMDRVIFPPEEAHAQSDEGHICRITRRLAWRNVARPYWALADRDLCAAALKTGDSYWRHLKTRHLDIARAPSRRRSGKKRSREDYEEEEEKDEDEENSEDQDPLEESPAESSKTGAARRKPAKRSRHK